MARQRNAHVGRSPQEREQYLETAVRRRQLDPTLADEGVLVRYDGTETAAADVGRGGSTGRRVPPPKEPSKVAQFVADKWAELLITTFVIGLGYAVYSQNREIGEMRVRLDGAISRAERSEKAVDDVENRLRQDIIHLQQRIDALVLSGPGPVKK